MFTYEQSQKVPAPIEQVWDFISSPANLKHITPPYMGFDVMTPNLPEKMYEGMIIRYNVSPLAGIKMEWVTEITHIKDLEFFVDMQQKGPYKFWHHQHHLKEIDGGVLMHDIVNYEPPYYFIGQIANKIIINKKLNEIFDFRRNKMEEVFGKF